MNNNLILVGDMVRRAIICTFDAKVERPEMREFEFDPIGPWDGTGARSEDGYGCARA
jgi:hypothetical protein